MTEPGEYIAANWGTIGPELERVKQRVAKLEAEHRTYLDVAVKYQELQAKFQVWTATHQAVHFADESWKVRCDERHTSLESSIANLSMSMPARDERIAELEAHDETAPDFAERVRRAEHLETYNMTLKTIDCELTDPARRRQAKENHDDAMLQADLKHGPLPLVAAEGIKTDYDSLKAAGKLFFTRTVDADKLDTLVSEAKGLVAAARALVLTCDALPAAVFPGLGHVRVGIAKTTLALDALAPSPMRVERAHLSHSDYASADECPICNPALRNESKS